MSDLPFDSMAAKLDALARENAQLREFVSDFTKAFQEYRAKVRNLTAENARLIEQVKRAGDYIEDNQQMRSACESASAESERIKAQFIEYEEENARLLAANRELAKVANGVLLAA